MSEEQTARSKEIEAAKETVAEFLAFVRSRPPEPQVVPALAKVLDVPRHVTITALLETALNEACCLYPGLADLDLHAAILPARNDDLYQSSERLEQFGTKWPDHAPGAFHAIMKACSANLYDRASRIATQLLGRSSMLNSLSARNLYLLLVETTQLGAHQLFFTLYERCIAIPGCIPEHSLARCTRTYANLRNDRYKTLQFVSLGTDCVPWDVGNRWGFRPFLTEDRQQLPMNLCAQTAHSCETILADGLAGFSDASQYATFRCAYGFDIGRHRGYGILFNHECGEFWLANGCERLVKRYQARVANFYSFAIKGPRVYVLYVPWNINLSEIEGRLADLAADDDYRLLVLDVRSTGNELRPTRPSTIVRKIEVPSGNFVWWQAFDTERGVRFELAIHDAMADAANHLTDKAVIPR
jgi:hypothetical protein